LADPTATVKVFDLHGNVSQSVDYRDLSGTVEAGDVVGTITFYQHNEVIATQDLVATETVPGPNVIESIGVWWTRLTAGVTGAQTQADAQLYNETPLINDRTQA
jgi:D-alanyl-D-alanine carboxypeptidase (penicillin-binding protein 5/6)